MSVAVCDAVDSSIESAGKTGRLHVLLKDGFSKRYGYTSDGGILHSMLNESNLTQEDVKCFLLSCMSFVNYLKSALA